MNKKNRFFNILIMLLSITLLISFKSPKKVQAYYSNVMVNTIYQSDKVITGYCDNYENITANINGKSYKATSAQFGFEVKALS